MKKIVYIDLDDCVFDYKELKALRLKNEPDVMYPQSRIGFFFDLEPKPYAIEVVKWLFSHPELDCAFATAPSLKNVHCYSEKRMSLDKHFGSDIGETIYIIPDKSRLIGDFLIDDFIEGKGQDKFIGTLLQFGSKDFDNWLKVKDYFINYFKNIN